MFFHNEGTTNMGRSGFKVIFRLFLLMSRWTWNQRSAWSAKQKCSHSPTTSLVNCGLIFAEKRGNFPWEFLSFLRRRMAANRSEQDTFEHQPSVPWSSRGRRTSRRAASSQFGQHQRTTTIDCVGLERRGKQRQMGPHGRGLWTVPKPAS